MNRVVRRFIASVLAALALAGCSTKRKAATPAVTPVQRPGVTIAPEQAVPSTSQQVKELLAEARKWLGTPYSYGGHSRKGTDCSGMIMELFLKIYNIRMPRSSAMQQEYSRPVKFADMKPGDLVFFATGSNKKRVSHVGLYIGDNRMIHASSSKGVMESGLSERYWTRTFHSSGRVIETDLRKAMKENEHLPVPEIDAVQLQKLYDALDQTIDSLYVTDPELFD